MPTPEERSAQQRAYWTPERRAAHAELMASKPQSQGWGPSLPVECPRGCGRVGPARGMGSHAASCWTPRTFERLCEIGKVVWDGDCALWQGRAVGEYGQGPGDRAHRLSLELKLGRKLERGEWALHSCDRMPCIAPDHLRVGDAKANNADRHARTPMTAETAAKIRASKLAWIAADPERAADAIKRAHETRKLRHGY